MPIKIPDKLPAHQMLVNEGIMVMRQTDAIRQDIRPLQVGLLNLMPNKIRTETQIARLIGSTPLQIELTLVRIGEHKSKNTCPQHLKTFYKAWEEIQTQKFDGFIVTGAPIEQLEFYKVTYWEKILKIFDWTKTNAHSTLTVCWGAMAAIQYFHGVNKYRLNKKAFGIFNHQNLNPCSPYLTGFADEFAIPVSRWMQIRSDDIKPNMGLEILLESEVTGPCLIHEKNCNRLYIFNHMEYDTNSLAEEYQRDLKAGLSTEIPKNYFPDDKPNKKPKNQWRSHAHLLFGNWINAIYQSVPFNPEEIGKITK